MSRTAQYLLDLGHTYDEISVLLNEQSDKARQERIDRESEERFDEKQSSKESNP